MAFDKTQTNICKGMAILLLLWRHLFLYGTDVDSLFYIFGMPIEIFLDNSSLVCVSVFLFLSGYGLQKSFEKYLLKNKSKKEVQVFFSFVRKHIVKLTMEYIFIFTICGIVNTIIFGNILDEVYDGNIWYLLINAFGLSNVFSTPTMYGTWWFNGLIFGLYLLFHLFWKLNKYCGEIMLFASMFILAMPGKWDFDSLRGWNLPFLFGMYFARRDILLKIYIRFDSRVKRILLSIMGLLAIVTIRIFILQDSEKLDAFFAVSVVIVSFFLMSRIPVLKKILFELGRSSSIMYLIHPLVFSLFFLLMPTKSSILIYIILTVICFLTARLVVLIQRIVRYDKLSMLASG